MVKELPCGLVGGALEWDGGYGYDPTMEASDADLIVTLHRTIDVQLAILRGGLVLAKRGHDVTLGWAIDIADAILGSDS